LGSLLPIPHGALFGLRLLSQLLQQVALATGVLGFLLHRGCLAGRLVDLFDGGHQLLHFLARTADRRRFRALGRRGAEEEAGRQFALSFAHRLRHIDDSPSAGRQHHGADLHLAVGRARLHDGNYVLVDQHVFGRAIGVGGHEARARAAELGPFGPGDNGLLLGEQFLELGLESLDFSA
jgi:hypothetical protein